MGYHPHLGTLSLPTDAVLALTYKCNSRCNMCDIWRITEHHDVKPEVYVKLPSTLKTVNISGGEPFLNPDIVEIIRNVKKQCPKAKLIISSNGFLPEFIQSKMKLIKAVDPHIGVAISIDGIGAMQEKIRGIPQGFEKNLKTIELLRSIGIHNLRIAFTAQKENITHFSKVYSLSRQLKVQFTCAVAQSSTFYFGGKQNERLTDLEAVRQQFDSVIAQELQSWSPKRWARAYFTYGLKHFALSSDPLLPAESAFGHFFMDPKGDIYPSVVHPKIMGNLQKQSFEEIWYSQQAEEARAYVRSNRTKVWMICTARSSMRRHPFTAGFWFLRQKLHLSV